MPRTTDARFDALADIYGRISDELADLLAEILVTTSAKRRMQLHTSVLRRLRNLDHDTAAWVENYLARILQEDKDRLGFFLLLGLSDDQQNEIVQDQIRIARARILATLAAAVISVRSFSSTITSGQVPQNILATVNAARQNSAKAIVLRSEIRRKLVSVTSVAGTAIRYEPGYYAALAAFMESSFASQEITKKAVVAAGGDLVSISPNPSTIGDFCDMYRGKVFSISGDHPDAPPLSSVPSGNVPMHPWCHHYLIPYAEAGKSSAQIRAASRLPKEFHDASAAGFSTNEFEKLWRSQAWSV